MLVEWPPGRGRHASVVLARLSGSTVRTAVCTGRPWDEERYGRPHAINWCGETPGVALTDWPRCQGSSWFYGGNVQELDASVWRSVSGTVPDSQVAALMEMWDEWEMSDSFNESLRDIEGASQPPTQ